MRDRPADGAAEGLDHLQHGEAVAGAEVDRDLARLAVAQGAKRGDVGLRQIDHVDVVAHAGAVPRGVVVAEDADLGAQAGGRLGHERHEVVRHAAGQFADQPAFVRASRIEVAKDRRLQRAAGRGQQVADHVLHDQLGLAVGVRGTERRVLADRAALGVAVHRGRAAEHEVLAALVLHGLQQRQRAADVVAVVAQRLLHALAHGLERGEVDHRVRLHRGEAGLQGGFIEQIELGLRDLPPAQRGEALEDPALAVAEVVDDVHVEAGRDQFDDGVRADIARAPRHQHLQAFAHQPSAFSSSGTIWNRSPTRPMSAISKIGASPSLLIATMVPASLMPVRCWMAPEMPMAT